MKEEDLPACSILSIHEAFKQRPMAVHAEAKSGHIGNYG